MEYILIPILLAIIVFIIKFYIDKYRYLPLARKRYEQALKSGDKSESLKYGRLYYSLLRDGNLSIYDEQAISNDINAMCDK